MRKLHRFGGWRATAAAAACLGASLVCSTPAGAQSDPATSYHDCYKSLRACQKQRCRDEVDQKEVDCVRQCNREYETCVSGASSSGAPPNVERSKPKQSEKSKQPRDVTRYRTPRPK